MSEDKKKADSKSSKPVQKDTKSSKKETSDKTSKTNEEKPKPSELGITASELADVAEAEARSALARSKAAKEAAEKALEEEYQQAAKEAVATKISSSFTNQRFSDQIFRREMGEPEFFLRKHELAPPRPILTPEEEEEISRRVEIPQDQTPKYTPENMLSPEYHGESNYESGIASVRDEIERTLAKLQKDPDSSEQEILQKIEDLKTIDNLFENYNLGMNVFRTAKGGRNKFDK